MFDDLFDGLDMTAVGFAVLFELLIVVFMMIVPTWGDMKWGLKIPMLVIGPFAYYVVAKIMLERV